MVISNAVPSLDQSIKQKCKPRRVVCDWILSGNLGQGSMGKVKLAINSVTKQKLACKIIPRPADAMPLPSGSTLIGPTQSIRDIPFVEEIKTKGKKPPKKDQLEDKRIIREAAISLLLHHPNIVSMQEVIVDSNFYYMFFEYVDGGQLLDFIIAHGMLNEKLTRRFMRQIISAVDYCHQNSIVHRDLKIENILIDKNGIAKLIDFGLANLFSPYSHLSTFCGSLYFAAPELLSAKKYIGPEVDMWSLGVILYVLVCGKVPFDDATMPELHARIKAGEYAPPTHVSKECTHLISRLLVVDPKKRASMEEVRTHPWVMRLYDESPENFIPARSPITLPLDSHVLKRMKGFGFGSESDIKLVMENYIKEGRHQGSQKWLVGGRAMSCPEAPIISLYYLVMEKYQQKMKKSSKNGRASPHSIETDKQRSYQDSSSFSTSPLKSNSAWKFFGRKSNTDEYAHTPESSPERAVPNKNSFRESDPQKVPSAKKTKTSFFKTKVNTMLHRRMQSDDTLKSDTGVFVSDDLSFIPHARSDSLPPELVSLERPESSRVLRKSKTREMIASHDDYQSIEEKELPRVPSIFGNGSRTSMTDRQIKTGFMATLQRNSFGRKRSKTAADLTTPPSRDEISVKSRASQLFSPSMAALRSISSRIRITKKERDPSDDIPGAATTDIKTAYMSSIFTIRNTTTLPPSAIRTELLRAFARVPNLLAIEQQGGFFCKYYDERSSINSDDPGKTGMFASMWSMLGMTPVKDTIPEKDLPPVPVAAEETAAKLFEHHNVSQNAKPKVQFEVYLRKIPWSELHGIQFNKISGDPWKYKQVCAQILSMTSL